VKTRIRGARVLDPASGRDELGDLEFACGQRVPRLGLRRMVERGGEPVGGVDDGGGAGRGGNGAGFVRQDGRLAAAPRPGGGLCEVQPGPGAFPEPTPGLP